MGIKFNLTTTGEEFDGLKGYTLRVGRKKSVDARFCFVAKIEGEGWCLLDGDGPQTLSPQKNLRDFKEVWLAWVTADTSVQLEAPTEQSTPEERSTAQWDSWLKAETEDVLKICQFAAEEAEGEVLEAAMKILEVIGK